MYGIQEIRDEQGLSVSFISETLGISQEDYKKIEKNELKLDGDKLTLLYKLLGVTPEDLNILKAHKNLSKDEIEMTKLNGIEITNL
jgi:transcriptional regulator with XRE-family HTH domain